MKIYCTAKKGILDVLIINLIFLPVVEKIVQSFKAFQSIKIQSFVLIFFFLARRGMEEISQAA